MNPLLGALAALVALLCCSLASSGSALDPAGKNVCQNLRDPSTLVCCSGWRQRGNECNIPVCEGEHACMKDETCVYPGVCRCPPGYYGAHCKTRCPPEFWSPDCRELCPCYPHGRCHASTGQCTCNANRWGPVCQYACKCPRHGRCHALHGNCTCNEGWWTPTCAKPCQCSTGGAVGPACDQLTGRCQCHRGRWGQLCSLSCNCYLSPCNQHTGLCECQAGWWGPGCDRRCNCDLTHSSCDPIDGQCVCQPGYQGVFCNQPCGAGKYGSGCTKSCGHCKDALPCSSTDGVCPACDSGWNGTRCDRQCPPGSHGDGCQETCPRCRNNEPCDPETGRCWRCEPGWTGDRCEAACSDGMYGDACSFLCGPCFHGNCNHVTGRCVCAPGFQGESCNSSCPALQYGVNCSSSCDCDSCHPTTGACPSSVRGAVLAGVLVPVLLLLVAVLCCCLCCGGGPADAKDRLSDGGVSVRIKYHVYSVLANIGAALPCISDWSSGLPRVTVSHHDPELTFNHSFIEPPSSGWVTEGSSFDSDEEEGEALYCVPPREDIPAVAGGEFQEMSSKCNMFLDPSGFSSEDMALTFNIPRTSSIAKSKRPSVSFAEGTRFSPKERRGSAQEPGAPCGRGKAKSPWGVLMLSALQNQGGGSRAEEEEEGAEGEEWEDAVDGQQTDRQDIRGEAEEQEVDRHSSTPARSSQASGRRRTMSNTAAHKVSHQGAASSSDAQASHQLTTVYVTVGKAGKQPVSKAESTSEGPVQAVLRRLGSLQRQREDRPKPKGAEAIAKPPRRKLGARATVWEQGGPVGGEEAICKPIRRKHANPNSPDTPAAPDSSPPESAAPKRPLSSILKSVPEMVLTGLGSEVRAEGARGQGGDLSVGQSEGGYLTVGPALDPAGLSEVIANEGAVIGANDEPSYENVLIQHS
ncbi:scavenger receptor class F member 1 [Genypterus blacodes]|uniref:scavenger receptor class F member 1 n=1 Tax=Genypterus blacodes TaxID=154954 RepID=UPI003F770934